MTVYYFAYGSNMSYRRISSRIMADRVGVGRVYGCQLKFHKPGSRDGTGKCNIHFSGTCENYILGVLYAISKKDKELLDEIEGVGNGYISKYIDVETDTGIVTAVCYVATCIDDGIKPLGWYKKHVLQGAMENGFDDLYIDAIRDIESIEDLDKKRSERELSIYE